MLNTISACLRRRVIFASPLDLCMLWIALTSVVMVLALITGRFQAVSSIAISSFLALLASGLILRGITAPKWNRTLLVSVFLAILALGLRWNPFPSLLGGQDQGLYVSISSHFARNGTLTIKDTVRETLSSTEKALYDRWNHDWAEANQTSPLLRNRYEGAHLPGVYVKNLAASEYVFQFYPLHSLWMALMIDLFGDNARGYSLVLLSCLNILILSLLAYELSGRKTTVGYLTAALLILDPMHVFFSKFPVSENVTVLFSATGIYYLIRAMKEKTHVAQASWYLTLSGAAWASLFTNHIAGFLYAPFLAFAYLGGFFTISNLKIRNAFVGYCTAIAAAYSLSLWFGMTKSFPYSYDVYQAVLTKKIGLTIINDWPVIAILLPLLVFTSSLVLTRYETPLRRVWTNLKLGPKLNVALIVIILLSSANSLIQGFRLGYSSAFIEDPYLNDMFRLTNSGISGPLHASITSLIIYVSPLFFLYFISRLIANHRKMAFAEQALLVFISGFWLLRIGVTPFTYYFYFGRYIFGEIMPYVLILGAIGLVELWLLGSRRQKIAAALIVISTFTWKGAALSAQYPGGEMIHLKERLRPLIQRAQPGHLVLLALDHHHLQDALRTTLDHVFGLQTAESPIAHIRKAIELFHPHYQDILVLTDSPLPIDYFAEKIEMPVRFDGYESGPMDVLPRNSYMRELHYTLYRLTRENRVRIIEDAKAAGKAEQLSVHSVIDFSELGNAERFLGSGWSNPEPTMRWSEGAQADLKLPIAGGEGPVELRMELRSHNRIDVRVKINNVYRTTWSFSGDEYMEKSLPLTKDDLKVQPLRLSLEMPNAISPHDLDPKATDMRKLGVSVRQLWLAAIGKDQNPGDGPATVKILKNP